MKRFTYIIFVIFTILMVHSSVQAQNTLGNSDDFSRIAIAPALHKTSADLPAGAGDVLLGKMKQMITLNGLSALNEHTLFIMYPEVMVISDETSPTAPQVYTLDLEVVFNLADRHTENVYASAVESLKGAGRSKTAAYKDAFKKINARGGKYKVMLEKGKEEIIEYYNTHCDLVISRSKSLASQKKHKEALALLNSVPPVSRECFDKANAVAEEIGRQMPEPGTKIHGPVEPAGDIEPHTAAEEVNLGNNIYLKYKKGRNIGEKTFLYFDLINKNEGDYLFKMHSLRRTLMINEEGSEVKVNRIKIGSKESRNYIEATLIPDISTELVCEFPAVKEVKYIRFYIHENQFKFKNLPINP